MLCAGRIAVAQPVPLPPGTTSDDQPAAGPLDGVESAIEAKNYALAAGRLDIYLSAHPNDARALFDRGFVEDAQGHADVAEGWYRKAEAANPKEFEPRLALGLLLAAKGDAKDDQAAIEQLQAAAQLQPNPPSPAAQAQGDRALARLLRTSDPTGARDALVGALKLTPETPADTLLAGQIAEAAGDLEIAEQEYREALKAQPELSDASSGLAHLLIAEKRYADAQPVVEAAMRRDADNPALGAQLATILNAQGKQAEALGMLEKLHGQQPDSRSIASMLADAEFQAGKLPEADALYQQLLTKSAGGSRPAGRACPGSDPPTALCGGGCGLPEGGCGPAGRHRRLVRDRVCRFGAASVPGRTHGAFDAIKVRSRKPGKFIFVGNGVR